MIARSAAHATRREEDQVPGQVRDVRQDLEDPWREIQRELAASVHEDTYRLWFSPLTPVSRRGATLYLTGPQRVIRWVGRRYMDLLRAATDRAVDGLREVELVSPDDAAAASPAAIEAASQVALNPDYTFERFVIGPGNQLAHAERSPSPKPPGRPTTRSSCTALPDSARRICSARSRTTYTGTARSSPSTTRPPSPSPTSSSPPCRAPASRASRSATAARTSC